MKNQTLMVYNVREVFNLRELVHTSCEEYGPRTAFLRHGSEDVEEITYDRFMENIRAFSTYLNFKKLGGKKIAVIGKNSYEWALTYLSVAAGVGIIVPVDKELKAAEIENIFVDSGVAAVVYSKDVASTIDAIDYDLLRIPMIDIESYLDAGRELIESGDRSYENHKVDANALGILLYTSGTTGVAKGVMLSHYNICSDIIHVRRQVLVEPDDRVLSVLPLHHTYECMAGFLTMIYSGGSIAYNESLRNLLADFKVFRPTIFVGVPLIIERFHTAIVKKYESLFAGRAILGVQKTLSSALDRDSKAVSKKIFSAIHDTFGGRLTKILNGAAALSPKVAIDLEKFGFKVYTGYGLTETSPVCIMHNDAYRNPYDIGYPLVGVKAKIVEPNEEGVGELAVSGPNIMLGYYNKPEETEKVMRDGWFYTGDLASKAENGAYRIVGRIKSMIVTKNGKKIFPEELEYYLNKHPYITESMVYGTDDDEGETTARVSIFPAYEAIDAELSKRGIVSGSEEYTREIFDIISAIVKDVNRKLPNFKMIRKINIRTEDFIRTTTRKIKRFAPENKAD